VKQDNMNKIIYIVGFEQVSHDAYETFKAANHKMDVRRLPSPSIAEIAKVAKDPETKIMIISQEHARPTASTEPDSQSLRRNRKDLFVGLLLDKPQLSDDELYWRALNAIKLSSYNLAFATRGRSTCSSMVVAPEETHYHRDEGYKAALNGFVEMTLLRSHLTFTRSTVVAGDPIAWESELVPSSLRAVVNHCIAQSAYRRVNGVTAGHFAVKIDNKTFLTSRRKTDFNELPNVGLVKIETNGPDTVLAYGSKPSVGGQSQRIVFRDHPGMDCIVHFHCPIKEGSQVPVVSQREFECGSHECGRNTSRGLKSFGNLFAVYLDSHGPNIVFNRNIDPNEVIEFIEANFDLSSKTGGYK
jgi:hypothetical protein